MTKKSDWVGLVLDAIVYSWMSFMSVCVCVCVCVCLCVCASAEENWFDY